MTNQPSSSDVNYVTEVEQVLSQLGEGLTRRADVGDPGTRIGKYEIVRVLHCHGQAVVVLAHDPDLDREVILKVYHAAASGSQRGRLINEGRALARIQAQHVATCFAVEEFEDFVFLVIEYVQGMSLRELLNNQQSRGGVTAEEAMRVVRELAEGVRQVHKYGLLHRDLKPENVMITPEGEVKLIDFGLVSLVDSVGARDRSGTPAYMAPESARGAEGTDCVDERSDIFGLGAILYDMLTGNPPFAAESNEASRVLARAGTVVPVRERRAEISPSIADLCMRCLAPTVDVRIASADELIGEMDRVIEEQSLKTMSGARSEPVGGADGTTGRSRTTTAGWWLWGGVLISAVVVAAMLAQRAGWFGALSSDSADLPDLAEVVDGEAVVDEGAVVDGEIGPAPAGEREFSILHLEDGASVCLRNRVEADRYIREDESRNAVLSTERDDRSRWCVESQAEGVALRNLETGRYLLGGNWEVIVSDQCEAGARWRAAENGDGSVSFMNLETERFLDGDGLSEGYDVDESKEVKEDDGWYVEPVVEATRTAK